MNNTILNWGGAGHNEIYIRQLKENPLYYDPNLEAWVTYSYEYCKAILFSNDALVPELAADANSPLNEKAKLLIRNLARINNNQQHIAARAAAMMMYQQISAAPADQLLQALLTDVDTRQGFDWVKVVAKQLFIRAILKGLDFNKKDCAYIAANLELMARIMSPKKTVEDVRQINAVVDSFYAITESNVIAAGFASGGPETTDLITCNLIGLFIQSYDGGWGLLCNTLLALAAHHREAVINKHNDIWYKKLVNETLRWDPPVHNTRRIAAKDIVIDGRTISAGETILVVLAAANLDDKVFNNPCEFHIDRSNNEQHLTFGLGGHNCVARYLNIGIATETCRFLVNNYQHIRILQKDIQYGPKLNVRLVEQLMVSLE